MQVFKGTSQFLALSLLLSTGAAAQPLVKNAGAKIFVKPDKVQYDTVGPVYPISEPDMLEEILKLVKKKQDSGEVDEINRQFAERAKRKIESPDPVQGITFAKVKRQWYYDPAITLTEDIVTPTGEIVAPRGQVISPLTKVTWSPWLFIDQRDASQMRTAKDWIKQSEADGKRATVVLVGGSWLKAGEALGRMVYFDQLGNHTTRFGIRSVPAEVVQDGLVLRVTEFPSK